MYTVVDPLLYNSGCLNWVFRTPALFVRSLSTMSKAILATWTSEEMKGIVPIKTRSDFTVCASFSAGSS